MIPASRKLRSRLTQWSSVTTLRPKYKNSQHEEEKEYYYNNYGGSFPLDELPIDITENILQRLSLGDRLRMTAVCKPWKHHLILVSNSSVIRLTPEIPWLLVPKSSLGKEKGEIISFYSMSDDRIYGLKVPKPVSSSTLDDLGIGGWCCCGSSKGWLVMSNEVSPTHDEFNLPMMNLFLLNPISGATINLPDLTSIPSAHKFHEELPSGSNFSMSMIKTIAVSASAADYIGEKDDYSSLVVAAILAQESYEEFDYRGVLAICRPQVDNVWTTFEKSDDNLGDILFYDRKLLIDRIREEGDQVNIDSIVSQSQKICDVKMEFLCIGEGDVVDPYVDENFYYIHLVESIHNELLLVVQYVKRNKTVRFEVYKYCVNKGQPGELISRMDDQVIFLASRGGSTCIQARNLDKSLLKGNQIYFASKFGCAEDSLQLGVYDLINKQVQLGPSVPSLALPNPTCWFTPCQGQISS